MQPSTSGYETQVCCSTHASAFSFIIGREFHGALVAEKTRTSEMYDTMMQAEAKLKAL